ETVPSPGDSDFVTLTQDLRPGLRLFRPPGLVRRRGCTRCGTGPGRPPRDNSTSYPPVTGLTDRSAPAADNKTAVVCLGFSSVNKAFLQESSFMSAEPRKSPSPKRFQLTVDGWAVAIALALALLVRLGLIHREGQSDGYRP